MNYAEGSITSNTPEVWRRLVGEKIVGAFTTRSNESTCIWLVTGSGAAFVFTDGGSFWRASADDVARETARIKADLDATIASLRDVLKVAGGAA